MDNKKNKFFIRYDLTNDNMPGYNITPENKSDVIDKESDLKKSILTTKNKELQKDNKTNMYSACERFNYSAGRGFGNLNISNEIRNGDSSRNDSKEFRESRESRQLFDYQFSYLDTDFKDPTPVMPMQRGGESTRKQNQLQVDTMRNISLTDNTKKNIDFKY
jgi:hypothetical protein